jgi:hypothetical protein
MNAFLELSSTVCKLATTVTQVKRNYISRYILHTCRKTYLLVNGMCMQCIHVPMYSKACELTYEPPPPPSTPARELIKHGFSYMLALSHFIPFSSVSLSLSTLSSNNHFSVSLSTFSYILISFCLSRLSLLFSFLSVSFFLSLYSLFYSPPPLSPSILSSILLSLYSLFHFPFTLTSLFCYSFLLSLSILSSILLSLCLFLLSSILFSLFSPPIRNYICQISTLFQALYIYACCSRLEQLPFCTNL